MKISEFYIVLLCRRTLECTAAALIFHSSEGTPQRHSTVSHFWRIPAHPCLYMTVRSCLVSGKRGSTHQHLVEAPLTWPASASPRCDPNRTSVPRGQVLTPSLPGGPPAGLHRERGQRGVVGLSPYAHTPIRPYSMPRLQRPRHVAQAELPHLQRGLQHNGAAHLALPLGPLGEDDGHLL